VVTTRSITLYAADFSLFSENSQTSFFALPSSFSSCPLSPSQTDTRCSIDTHDIILLQSAIYIPSHPLQLLSHLFLKLPLPTPELALQLLINQLLCLNLKNTSLSKACSHDEAEVSVEMAEAPLSFSPTLVNFNHNRNPNLKRHSIYPLRYTPKNSSMKPSNPSPLPQSIPLHLQFHQQRLAPLHITPLLHLLSLTTN